MSNIWQNSAFVSVRYRVIVLFLSFNLKVETQKTEPSNTQSFVIWKKVTNEIT